jgi:hypothetical protein
LDQNNVSLKTQAMLEHLVLQGAVEMSGIDSNTGEMLYYITDKLKLVHPGLYEQLKGDFEKRMFEMIDRGPEIMQWKFNSEFFE